MIGVEMTDNSSRTKAANSNAVNGVAGRNIVVLAKLLQRSDSVWLSNDCRLFPHALRVVAQLEVGGGDPVI